jgi:hypothetical protein
MVVKITTKPEHPINRHLKNKKAYDQYGLRPSLTTPFLVKAKETGSILEVDFKEVDTTMLALPKGSTTLRIRAELGETLNANYLDYTQIYTNGSKMEERVGCAVVTTGENQEIRLPRLFSILYAEAISITRNTIQPKRVILSDSLSCLTALDGMRKIYNPKMVRMMNQIHREKEHLILMWVPAHAGIQRNEKADQHAEAARQGKTKKKSYKTVAEGWKKWIKEK